MIQLNKSGFITFFLICISNFINGQPDLFDYDHTLKFARYLSKSGQYGLASEEYERLNFLKPGDTTVILEQIVNYRLGNQCDKLKKTFGNLRLDNINNQSYTFIHEYLRFSLLCKIDSDDYFKVSSFLNPDEKCFYELSYFWIHTKPKEAFRYNQLNQLVLSSGYAELYDLTNRFEKEKYKKPFIAAFMSCFLPGSGKAYSKRWGDAFISFLFVGTNGWTAYRSFKKKGTESINGWIFGTLACSFYISNIWGSAKAASNYNSGIKQRYQENAEKIIYNSY
jgi:hypothetical protein